MTDTDSKKTDVPETADEQPVEDTSAEEVTTPAEVDEPVEETSVEEPEVSAEAEKPVEESASEEVEQVTEADEPVDTATAEEPEAEETVEEAEASETTEEPAAEKKEAAEDSPEAVETPVESETSEEPETPEEPENPDLKWYVLRVQSNKEESVQENLEKRIKVHDLQDRIVRVLVPVEKVSEIKGGKKRISKRKVYPGYVMVQMVFDDDTWYLVRETPGIGDFVGGAPNTRPMPMPQHEVDKMLGEAEKDDDDLPTLKIAFNEGDSVKINEGHFENFNGVVREVIPAKGVVIVEVTIFGRPTPVELEYWQIETI